MKVEVQLEVERGTFTEERAKDLVTGPGPFYPNPSEAVNPR